MNRRFTAIQAGADQETIDFLAEERLAQTLLS
jgi:hypothetical protein